MCLCASWDELVIARWRCNWGVLINAIVYFRVPLKYVYEF